MADYTAPGFLDQLRTRLVARPGLAGVGVWTADPGQDATLDDLTFFGADGTQEWATMGRGSGSARDDRYEIPGDILIVRPLDDDTEAIIKATRDRAAAILKELADELRTDTTVGAANVFTTEIASLRLDQGASDRGRWCQIEFRLRVRARI